MRFVKKSAALLLPLALALLVAAQVNKVHAEAADGAKEDAADSRSAAFQAVEGPQEQVPGGPLFIGAYAVILVLLVAYVARLGSLQSKNQVELERLTRALEAARKS